MPQPRELPLDPSLSARISEISRLAGLPQMTWELMGLLRSESTSASDLQKVIETDLALSAKILSLANSSYYSPQQPATTIERAIVIIGFKELEFLALGVGLADSFDLRRVPANFDGEGLWLHSLAVAWVSRQLAQHTGAVEPGEAMMAGLLHDLGKLILATNFSVHLKRLLDLTAQGLPYCEAEDRLKLWHTAIGYQLGFNWRLPEVYLAVILNHHDASLEGNFAAIVATVALADYMVKNAAFGLYHECRPVDVNYLREKINLNEAVYCKLAGDFPAILLEMSNTWRNMLGSVVK